MEVSRIAPAFTLMERVGSGACPADTLSSMEPDICTCDSFSCFSSSATFCMGNQYMQMVTGMIREAMNENDSNPFQRPSLVSGQYFSAQENFFFPVLLQVDC